LLQAVCHQAQAQRQAFAYLPFAEFATLTPELLDGLESSPLVCFDDLQAVTGVRVWEEALFTLVERLRAHHGLLVVAANAAPTHIGLTLPDLVTRLTWGPVYPLHALSDEEKLAA